VIDAGGRSSVVASVVRSFAIVGLCACSSNEEVVLPYPVGQAMVFGESKDGGVMLSLGSRCTSEACLAVRERCGGDVYAEVILATTGSVLDVICYRADLDVRQLAHTPFESIGEESNTVFIIDDIDDGADLLDQVVVSGDNDVLYGSGAALSVLGAGLDLAGLGSIVRALTVRGDVTVKRNDAKLSLVEIWGDLTINGNRVTLSESIVHGDVLVVGTDAVLARNVLANVAPLEGTNLRCALNQRFDDLNRDREIDPDELGVEVECR
jgi:hypothetical protein